MNEVFVLTWSDAINGYSQCFKRFRDAETTWDNLKGFWGDEIAFGDIIGPVDISDVADAPLEVDSDGMFVRGR